MVKLVEMWENHDMERYRTMDKGGWENKYRVVFQKFRYLYDHCAIHGDGTTRIDPRHSARVIDGRRKEKNPEQTVTQFYEELKRRDTEIKRRAPKGGDSSKKRRRIADAPLLPPPPPPPHPNQIHNPNFFRPGGLWASFECKRDLNFAQNALDDQRYSRTEMYNRHGAYI